MWICLFITLCLMGRESLLAEYTKGTIVTTNPYSTQPTTLMNRIVSLLKLHPSLTSMSVSCQLLCNTRYTRNHVNTLICTMQIIVTCELDKTFSTYWYIIQIALSIVSSKLGLLALYITFYRNIFCRILYEATIFIIFMPAHSIHQLYMVVHLQCIDILFVFGGKIFLLSRHFILKLIKYVQYLFLDPTIVKIDKTIVIQNIV